jgi:hypothetical protein
VVIRLACVDGGFVVVSGNVVSSTIHYLQSVLPGFCRFQSVSGVELWCFVWFVMIGDLGLWLET